MVMAAMAQAMASNTMVVRGIEIGGLRRLRLNC